MALNTPVTEPIEAIVAAELLHVPPDVASVKVPVLPTQYDSEPLIAATCPKDVKKSNNAATVRLRCFIILCFLTLKVKVYLKKELHKYKSTINCLPIKYIALKK